jgi:antirestriction protein ArdC
MQEIVEKKDVYTRITSQIVAQLEKGVRPWSKPWNAEHAAGRITRPLRHNGQPYSGINILSLWMSAELQGFAAPIWMTFRQACELDAHVRKGEKGSLVVFANSITRTEHDDKTGEDTEREIPYMKGYTAFNVEQIDGLPEIYYAKVKPGLDPIARIDRAEKFFAAGSGKAREISLGEDFGDVAVKVNGVRVEVHTDGSILAYTNGRVDAYTNGPVQVHPAANDASEAKTTHEIGGIERNGDHKGEMMDR